MSFHFLRPFSDSFRRIAFAAAFLTSLWAAKVSSAAEMTFSGNYSLQLPAGWTAEAQADKSLIGAGPGEVSFGAKAWPSEISPAEYMEKALVNIEKRPGYKLIEKTAVKTNPDRKAQRLRYQIDGPKGPQSFVRLYSQLSKTEVVVLLFQLPNFSSTAAKNDIEAIFNSVKMVSANAQEDSWSTSPAPAPAAPKTAGTRVTFATNCSVEIPAGWTGKSGDHLQGTGPGDTIVDGFSIKGAMTVDEAVAELTAMLGKTFTGFKLLETVDMATEAGAKGKLLHYQSDGKGDSTTRGFCAVIKAAANQIVSLRFSTPNATKKLDPALFDGVRTISRSLKIIDGAASVPGDARSNPPAATKPKADSNTADEERAIRILGWMRAAGKYVYQKNPANYIVLKEDGTFSMEQNKTSRAGTYTSRAATITFKFSEGDEDSVKFDKDTMIDKDGDRWVKKP